MTRVTGYRGHDSGEELTVEIDIDPMRPRRRMGDLLRHYRKQAKMTQAELGERLRYSESQVRMVELGNRVPKGDFMAQADAVLGAEGALIQAEREARRNKLPVWFGEYAAEEEKARSIHWYEQTLIPGLLQNEEYARAVFRCHVPALEDEDVEEKVAIRLARHAIFGRQPKPMLSFVIEESGIRRPIGGPDVLKGALHHLREMAGLRHVQIQIMPQDSQTHACLNGPFILLETEDHRNTAYIEVHTSGLFLDDPAVVSDMNLRYGMLRAQALSPEDSVKLIEQVAREQL
ncbi:helix-turn-helix transcriptional regulator [Streptomyces sp. B1866]|uniref:helix-turn-helix domain-containing protein n=1 Tax=Streptomyces sp. B1866 TaxID=3075431 RepID=UPI0028927E84|nr:helix-turn-helix transcriptional regulator [Streptomyces sp. B1866]MDT3397299.1 helix-turn-helix transcriptional regulator [Streptomyces sp. B1866]